MNQRGFTLLEMLVALAVGVMILASVVGGLFMITRGTPAIRQDLAALAAIDEAAHWLTRDVMMGLTADLVDNDPPVGQMVVSWSDFTKAAEQEATVSHSVSYTWLPGTGELQRNYDGVVTIVGKNLSNVEFSLNGKFVTVTLTSTIDGEPGATLTRSYKLLMRSEEGL